MDLRPDQRLAWSQLIGLDMISDVFQLIRQSLVGAWRLRWQFQISHIALLLLATVVISPVTAGFIQLAVTLSGSPALADQDIARFLFSPIGLISFVIGAGILITAAVLDVAFLMAIAMAQKDFGSGGFRAGLARVLPQLPILLEFAMRLVVRLGLIAVPFLAVTAFIALRRLNEYDINYYLTFRPPEFLISVALIGALLIVLVVLLVRRLLAWSLALPAILFSGTSAKEAFAVSEQLTLGRHRKFLLILSLWFVLSLVVAAIVLGGLGLVVNILLSLAGDNLRFLAAMLTVALVVGFLVNLTVTAVTTGALAILLNELFVDSGGRRDRPREVADLVGLRRKLLFVLPFGLIAMAIGFGAVQAFLSQIDPSGDVEVIAHRGAAGARPENTMASVLAAIEAGADWVEIDVQESADGTVVVVHDSDFMKLAGVNLKVWQATDDDLAGIDIGSWFDSIYQDERTPTLRQVLLAAKDKTKVLIELKYYGRDVALEERTIAIVKATGMADQVAFMSLKYPAVLKLKALQPDWQVGLLAATAVGDLTRLDADFLAVATGLSSRNLIGRAGAAGKPVFSWTVNDALSMTRMISRGVSGLITDEPALARQVIAQRAGLSAPERLILSLGSLIDLHLDDRVYRDGSP